MTFNYYLFEANPQWEKAVDRGLFKSGNYLLAGMYLFMDLTGIVYLLGEYPIHSAKLFAGLLAFFCLFLFLLAFSSYYVLRLCDETRERLRSGFVDAATRRTLLNVSYMGYRLYLILLLTPSMILAIQSVRP